VLQQLAGWLGWGERGTQGSKTQGQHLEAHHCQCPNWDQSPGEGAKVGTQQRDEARDEERAEGAMSVLRTNDTTEGALLSGEQDPHVWPRRYSVRAR